MSLTTIHDRRQRLKAQTQRMKETKEQEIAKVTARAVKRYTRSGSKKRGIAILMDSIEGQLAALEQYIDDLRLIGEEMELRYPQVNRSRLWMIDHEINTAVESIARLRIKQVSPGE